MKSNFKRNLVLGFGISLIILIISSVASLVSIFNLLESAKWVNHTNEVIIQMDAIRAGLVDAESGQRGFLVTGNPEFLDPYQDAKTRTLSAFETVKQLTSDNDEQQRSLNDLNTIIDERFAFLQTSIDAKKNNEPTDNGKLLSGKLMMDKVRNLIRIMEERERQLLTTRTDRMDKFSSYTPVIIVVAALIALVITALFYTRVRSDFEERARLQQELQTKEEDISRRINIIRGVADKITQGNYSIRVDDTESDSLGSVAGSLNRMAQSLDYSFGLLSDKEWLQAGLSKLNDLMIGDKSIEALTSQIIDFLATYSGSHTAVLYLADGNELSVIAGYAFVPDQKRPKLKAGEGLAGQAIANGKSIEIKDIPTDSIQVLFATGMAKPSHIIAIPIFDGLTIKGVLELASLHSFSEREIEFLKGSAHNIGIAISTSQNKRRMQELLEETQSQAEELKTQHAELENMNSELEVQAEKLQASEEELRVQQEELRQSNQELEERSRLLEERNQVITERNLEIQAKAEELAQSTRYKSEFLANMSHELRTPLNSILLLSRLLSENLEKNLNPEQIEYAKVMLSSGHGLLSLIDEILDLSKIEAGKMEVEYMMVSVNEVINDMASMFTPVTIEKGIEFKTLAGKDLPEFMETDKLRLQQILRNLLSNAIKFTSEGFVSLSIEKDALRGGYLKFTVRDTGIGIPKEKHALVFEAFQQADGSTRRKYGGTCLGLSISRELAKLLGGEITMKSEPGEGSDFVLHLPVSQKAITTPIVSRAEVVTMTPPVTPVPVRKFISTDVPENIPDDRGDIGSGDKTILIVEDDINFAKALLDYTRTKGYKGVVAVRGDEGIELAKQFLPVGVLLDIQLPVKSGWEVMDELKSDTKTRHIPVHIMSSYTLKSESLMKGAVDFINKPVAFDQMQEIFKKIEHVLTHHPKKVLIVEENAKHAKALAYFLETFDVTLEIKTDVGQAIESLKSKDVDCVILDMVMPHENAYATLDVVKKTPGLENLPIIIFTGKSLSQNEELRIKQYADSIVVKTAHSYRRILDEVSLFLHLMESKEKKETAPPKYHQLGALDEVLKNKTVLIADDDMRNIFSMTKALEKYQMNVIAVVNGKDALQKLKEKEVDIVLMDMMMPEMDGYESTRAIRKDPAFRDLPIIAVTAKAMMGDRAKCIEAGASDYISKPVDFDQLFSLLRVWLYEKGKK